MKRLRKVKIVEKKLKRQNVDGLWHPSGLIEIDPRLDEKRFLTVLIHELMHEAMPYLDEDEVDTVSTYLGDMLHDYGFKKQLR